MELLGCSPDFLWEHLISQFKDGMIVENYGEWRVDHIKPCSKFDLSKEQKKCFHYLNLQPLRASENCSKGSKYEEKIDTILNLEDDDTILNLDNEDFEDLLNFFNEQEDK